MDATGGCTSTDQTAAEFLPLCFESSQEQKFAHLFYSFQQFKLDSQGIPAFHFHQRPLSRQLTVVAVEYQNEMWDPGLNIQMVIKTTKVLFGGNTRTLVV